MAKEKCAKESQRHGDSGKKPFIAHFDGGARYVARSGVGQLTPTVVRARSSPFPAVKMGGPFSLRCLSPLCSPAVGVGHTQPLQGFCFRRSGWRSDLPLAGGFRNAIGQAAGSRTRPASREACRRAAVTPQSSRFPSSTPAPHGRGVGCRGTPPAVSREARRRAAALGTKAAGTRGHPPNVPKAPYLPV